MKKATNKLNDLIVDYIDAHRASIAAAFIAGGRKAKGYKEARKKEQAAHDALKDQLACVDALLPDD